MGGGPNQGDKQQAGDKGQTNAKGQQEQARKVQEARLKKERERKTKEGKTKADNGGKSSATGDGKLSAAGERDKHAAQSTADKSKVARAAQRLNKAESATPKDHISYPKDKVTGRQLEVQRSKDGSITNVIDMQTGKKDSKLVFGDHHVGPVYDHLPANEQRFWKKLDQVSRDQKAWERANRVEPGSERTRLRGTSEKQGGISPELRLDLDLGKHPWDKAFFREGRLYLPDAGNKSVGWIDFRDIPEGATCALDGRLSGLDRTRYSSSDGPAYWVYKKGETVQVLPRYSENPADIRDMLQRGKPLVDKFGDVRKEPDERNIESVLKANKKLNGWMTDWLRDGESLESARGKVKERALLELKSVISSEVLTMVMGMAEGLNVSFNSGSSRGRARRTRGNIDLEPLPDGEPVQTGAKGGKTPRNVLDAPGPGSSRGRVRRTRGNIDLEPLPDEEPLRTGGRRLKRPREVRGAPSTDNSGTGGRTGMHFHEYNAAEIEIGLKVNWDARAGRPRSVSYRIDGSVVAKGEQATTRHFRRDSSTTGVQPTRESFSNSGHDAGHLVQREAAKINPEVELAVDHTTMVVPMSPKLNRGRNSPWRTSERNAVNYAKDPKYGSVTVEVEVIYSDRFKTLRDGTPIPDAFRRRIKAPDGTVLDEGFYKNEL